VEYAGKHRESKAFTRSGDRTGSGLRLVMKAK
jgi:hypothetical protein